MLVGTFEFGDSTPLGWATFGLYMVASAFCLRCARTKSARSPWLWQADALLLLGLNKQLDLQTLLLKGGREIALATGWFGYRRAVEVIFFAGLLACTGFVLARFAKTTFARAQPLMLKGDICIGAYVLIRACSTSQVDTTLGFDLENLRGLWTLEILGLLLLLAGASKAYRSLSAAPPNS